jgi:hypothetical protein
MSEQRTEPYELCGRVTVDSSGGAVSLSKWWSHREDMEMLQFGREVMVPVPEESNLITETEFVGLLDSAWSSALLSAFARRQIFQLVMRHYQDQPADLWSLGPDMRD